MKHDAQTEAAANSEDDELETELLPSPEISLAERLQRQRKLSERAEQCLQESLQTRTLLREVEQMLREAARPDTEGSSSDDDGGTSAGASPTPPRARGEPRRGAAASGARAGCGTSGVSAIGGWCEAGERDRGEADERVSGAGLLEDPAEALRRRRLEQCDELSSQLHPMRHRLDLYGGRLGQAADENERIRKEIGAALDISAEEIEAELALQGLFCRPQPVIRGGRPQAQRDAVATPAPPLALRMSTAQPPRA